MNDYYLNLLHWGKTDIIAVALSDSLYLWHASDGHIDMLTTVDTSIAENYISSVQWSEKNPTQLAIGTNANTIEIWDTERLVKLREMNGHNSRVSSLSWNHEYQLLSSGSRDSQILNHDVRVPQSIQSAYLGHTQEVCGLTWSPDGMTLVSRI